MLTRIDSFFCHFLSFGYESISVVNPAIAMLCRYYVTVLNFFQVLGGLD